MLKRLQTDKEEFYNAWSHGIGFISGLVGIPFLLLRANGFEEPGFLLACMAFSIGILMVYSSSTLYHLAKPGHRKDHFQKADHISIYFLIAGSYTPMILTVLQREKAILFLAILWAFVLAGSIFKFFFAGKYKFVSVGLYLAMGWVSVFLLKAMWENLSGEILTWIAVGGLSYSVGVYFYVNSNRLYYHTIWHVFVLFGTISHFISVMLMMKNP
ncbi:MAG: hemolysin III [Algoriphagus sp.]|jgi:hemolysin III